MAASSTLPFFARSTASISRSCHRRLPRHRPPPPRALSSLSTPAASAEPAERRPHHPRDRESSPKSAHGGVGGGVVPENSANADRNEVDKFSSFASRWWDSRSNPLVGMNPVRVKFMTETFARHSQPRPIIGVDTAPSSSFRLPFRGRRVLDIGCGGGLLTESFSRLGASLVAGVDASSRVTDVAKIHSSHDNSDLKSLFRDDDDKEEERKILYVGGRTVEEFASHWLSEREKEGRLTTTKTQPATGCEKHERFDVVTALEVIEHVPDPSSLLRAAASLLKPGGLLFVSTINRTAKSYGVAIVGAEYVTGKVPRGTHDWNQFLGPEEVERMVCDDAGSGEDATSMERVAMCGMVVNPLTMEWSLSPSDVDVNWIGAYRKKGAAP